VQAGVVEQSIYTSPVLAPQNQVNGRGFPGQPATPGARRRIGVVSTSRADYSHLYWPLRELAVHPQIELGVFAL
jgi:hypothetical protein